MLYDGMHILNKTKALHFIIVLCYYCYVLVLFMFFQNNKGPAISFLNKLGVAGSLCLLYNNHDPISDHHRKKPARFPFRSWRAFLVYRIACGGSCGPTFPFLCRGGHPCLNDRAGNAVGFLAACGSGGGLQREGMGKRLLQITGMEAVRCGI